MLNKVIELMRLGKLGDVTYEVLWGSQNEDDESLKNKFLDVLDKAGTGSVVHGRCPSNFWQTWDVRKSVSASVSAGQSRHKLALKVLWPGLTSDMTGINADKKVLD